MRLPDPGGLTDTLAELKFIGGGESWFPRGVAGRGSDRRAPTGHKVPWHSSWPIWSIGQEIGKFWEGEGAGGWSLGGLQQGHALLD